MESINPATGERLRVYEETSPGEVDGILRRAASAALAWRSASFAERARCLASAAGLLRAGADENARRMALEMGKPVAQGRAEVEKCAWACDYYAEHGERFLAPEMVATDARRSLVVFRPLGPVLAIMPWNFPFWQVFRFAAPALMAGNAGVLKHASNVSGCALAIEALLREAGFPEDLFRAVLLPSGRVADMIAHPAVSAVTLTGSTAAGRAVAAAAGAAVKKTVLELGGSDAYVVLEDADLPRTVEACAAGRMINGGQSCIAAKRFIVVEPLVGDFEAALTARLAETTMGDPLQEDVDLGPQARRSLRDALHRQVVESVAAGARLLLGGTVPDGPGAFYPPTVLADVAPGMPAFDEETFGPVAAIVRARDEADALRLANASAYGLGAAVFTADLARGERIAADGLEAGCCFVNAYVRSDPRLPFGGVKDSGYGRELGEFGIREFVNVKSIYVG